MGRASDRGVTGGRRDKVVARDDNIIANIQFCGPHYLMVKRLVDRGKIPAAAAKEVAAQIKKPCRNNPRCGYTL